MVASLTQPAAARRNRRRRIGILDLATKNPRNALYGRLMNANLASIMPQVLAVWCEEAGHEVHYACYTGGETLTELLPRDLDLVFIGAFTQAAQLAYSLQHSGSFADLAALVSAGYVPQDILGTETTGYRFSVTTDGKTYAARAEPARYGRTGRLSFYMDGGGIQKKDAGGKPLSPSKSK